MFRLEFIKLQGHPQLGDLMIDLVEKNELKNCEKPYTSVIIGSNGTGKSYILRTIAEVFRQFNSYFTSEKKEFNLPFNIHLRYKLNDNTYEIVTRNIIAVTKKGTRRNYIYFKNRPLNVNFISRQASVEIKTGYEITLKELEFPTSLLVNSVIPTDRFVRKNSNKGDFYQYLGARSTSSTTSTKSLIRRTIKHLFNATAGNDVFIKNLKNLLSFLEFNESLKVEYRTRINKLFFSDTLNTENFKKYFEKWWAEDFEFSKRKEENPSWSVPYYNKYFKNNERLVNEIVEYLKVLAVDPQRLKHKHKSSSKILEIDLFDPSISEYDLTMISHLENLDIINLEGMKFLKDNIRLSVDGISSGEYHLLNSLIGIFANITQNSLILIDEPEISLHPNWQMQYISFLKKVFENFSSCHFLLTTHSHFLVSDLEGKSSAVIALNRDVGTNLLSADLLEGENTFGWSAEDVLYRVFNVKTTSNYFLEMDLRNALTMIKNKSKTVKELDVIIERLNKLQLNQADPTNEIIKDIKKYRSVL